MDTLTKQVRAVARLAQGMPASDGDGVKLTRVIGTPRLGDVDPFLMLDEFRSADGADYVGGFPDHPHRGFETVTIMLAGRMRHRDNKGNSGLLTAGSVQWMTAGRGIVHSEMPEQEEGLMAGFQLWVNLPAKDKMIAPRYQDIAPNDIPVVEDGGATVRVLAGKFGHVQGAVRDIVTAPVLLDVALKAGAKVFIGVPTKHAAFVYPFEGSVGVGEPVREVPRGTAAVLSEGDTIELQGLKGPSRILVAAARPLGEPVARYGPFVMNTQDELRAAFADYQAGKF
jgi:quercetin 2,3-dioxygenase